MCPCALRRGAHLEPRGPAISGCDILLRRGIADDLTPHLQHHQSNNIAQFNPKRIQTQHAIRRHFAIPSIHTEGSHHTSSGMEMAGHIANNRNLSINHSDQGTSLHWAVESNPIYNCLSEPIIDDIQNSFLPKNNIIRLSSFGRNMKSYRCCLQSGASWSSSGGGSSVDSPDGNTDKIKYKVLFKNGTNNETIVIGGKQWNMNDKSICRASRIVQGGNNHLSAPNDATKCSWSSTGTCSTSHGICNCNSVGAVESYNLNTKHRREKRGQRSLASIP